MTVADTNEVDDMLTPSIELFDALHDLEEQDVVRTDSDADLARACASVIAAHDRFVTGAPRTEQDIPIAAEPEVVIVVSGDRHVFPRAADRTTAETIERTIGRQGDLILTDPRASRHHLALTIEPSTQSLRVRDLSSGNGSWLVRDGVRHRLDDERVTVRPGDVVVTIDDVVLATIEMCAVVEDQTEFAGVRREAR